MSTAQAWFLALAIYLLWGWWWSRFWLVPNLEHVMSHIEDVEVKKRAVFIARIAAVILWPLVVVTQLVEVFRGRR